MLKAVHRKLAGARGLWSTYSRENRETVVQNVNQGGHPWKNVKVSNSEDEFTIEMLDSFGLNIPVAKGVHRPLPKIDLLFVFSSRDTDLAPAAKLLASLYSKTDDMACAMTFESAAVDDNQEHEGSSLNPERMMELYNYSKSSVLEMTEHRSQAVTEDLLLRTRAVVCTSETQHLFSNKTTHVLDDLESLHSMGKRIRDIIFDATPLDSLFNDVHVSDIQTEADVTNPEALNETTVMAFRPNKDKRTMAIRNVIGKLTQVESLTIENGAITYVSPHVSKLTNLQYLWLREIKHTDVWKIMYAFKQIPNLRELAINGCSLGSFTISDLSKLEKLDLWNNGLSSVSLSDLPMLETLDLSDNELTSLPDVSNLPMLETLNLSDNNLTSLPDVSNLTRLKTLDLRRNTIESLPESVPQGVSIMIN